MSNAVAIINDAVNSMAAGETRVLHIHATYIGDEDIDRLFDLASALHTNFYEDWYGAGRVERGLRDIEIFIDKLQPSVNEVTASPVATGTRLASTIRAVSNSAPNDRREQRLGSGRVVLKLCHQPPPLAHLLLFTKTRI